MTDIDYEPDDLPPGSVVITTPIATGEGAAPEGEN